MRFLLMAALLTMQAQTPEAVRVAGTTGTASGTVRTESGTPAVNVRVAAVALPNPDTGQGEGALVRFTWVYPGVGANGALPSVVVLATVATIIASQAVITGAYSLSQQAIQLGLLPRMEIRHTSSEERGQIYLPLVNQILMVSCIGLVLGFKSSSALSAAYGIAVTLTMLITTVLFYFAARRLWNWSQTKAGVLCAVFLIIEALFFAANSLKIAHGGWFPLVGAALVLLVMTTWKRGRQLLGERLSASLLPFVIRMNGWLYLASALMLGGIFIGYAIRIYVDYSDSLAQKTFRYSILYLSLLFAALLADHYLVA